MSKNPILTRYVSEVDQFLQKFDSNHPSLSLSQQKEKDKYQRIYRLRDHTDQSSEIDQTLWDQF